MLFINFVKLLKIIRIKIMLFEGRKKMKKNEKKVKKKKDKR